MESQSCKVVMDMPRVTIAMKAKTNTVLLQLDVWSRITAKKISHSKCFSFEFFLIKNFQIDEHPVIIVQ